MNSLGSTIESDQNASTFGIENYSCTAVDKTTRQLCGETESMRIIDEFQKLYETRLENVDKEFDSEYDRVCMKLEIMREWIKDLAQQNITLVQIVEDLEQAACNRVELLEHKLRQSSVLVSERMTNSNHTEKTINTLSNRINGLEKDDKYMRQRIECLQSDIKGLLQLIQRAVQEKHWNLDGIKFFEIQPNDIPVPLNCTCDQEEVSSKKIQSLKFQVEHLQENEQKMLKYQKELEDKLTSLNVKLENKESTIKKYASQLQNFNDNLKKHAKFEDQVTFSSFLRNDQGMLDIMLMADIVENMLIEKDLEARKLQQRLCDTESNLQIITRKTDTDLNNLKVQLNEKCIRIEEIEKEALKKQGALTAELFEKNDTVISLQKKIAALQEQYRCANMQIRFKEDIIKEMRKELKQTMAKETQIICVDANGCREDAETFSHPINQSNQVVLYFTKVKSLMEQQKENLTKFKVELEKTVEQLCCEKDEDYCKPKDEYIVNTIVHRLTKNIACLNKMCSQEEETIAFIKSVLKLENNNSHYVEIENLLPCTDVNRRFKLMDVLRTCALEAQITTENIKDEMSIIVSTFKSRHQKYIDLNKEVTNVQNQLIKSREKISETINRVQLQEEEQTRHNERINLGKIKLKDIKNEINHAKSQFSVSMIKMQNDISDSVMTNYTDIGICNDLLCSVIEEIEQISNSIQVFQNQGCCAISDLRELKCQLCEIDCVIKGQQQKIDEALLEHDIVETALFQRELNLEKLEKEVDVVHFRIENILETFIPDSNVSEPQSYTQTLNEIFRTKQDLYRLRKEHDELKFKISQKSLNAECDENTCLWKYRVSDLQDQVKILQHEAKCKQEANDFLRNSIESMEEEVHVTQGKAEKYRRSHSMDSMEFKKKIIELENALKLQKEMESTLRHQLNESELELKKSKELLKSVKHTEHSADETLLRCGCTQFRHDTTTVPQLFKTLESTIHSMKYDLQELKMELKKLVCKDQSNSCSSIESLKDLMDRLQKYENDLDSSFQEIEKLKSSFSSKDKLIEDRDKMIQIQKDSIEVTRTELKKLHQKLQEKIDNQDQIISQYEKEKKDLLRQNELQIQTIGHLQSAVVESKRCIDQMSQKNTTDLQEKNENIRLLTVYADETQNQYNDCFAEAAKQDKLLDLQRDVIYDLQQRICSIEHDNSLTVTSTHIIFNTILRTVQEQLEARVTDFQALKYQVDALVQSKCCLENKYLNMKKLRQVAEKELLELKRTTLKPEETGKTREDKGCQCTSEMETKIFSYGHDLQSEVDTLTRENKDMKKQLQKYKLDFDIIEKELRIERENDTCAQKMRNVECHLRLENEQLKSDLKQHTMKIEDLLEKLQFVKENGPKFEKLLKTLEDKQMQINSLYCQITNNETVMEKQTENIKDLEKQLDANKKQTKGYLAELNEAEELMTTLHDRIHTLKMMLNEKSDDLAKLEADYEVLKNDNSILKMTNDAFENKMKEDVCQLKKVLKDMQMQLCFTENNYQKATKDFNKTQEQLIIMTQREADLQECLTNMEKDYCLKLSNAEKEKNKLADCLDKLRDELNEMQRNYSSNRGEHCKLQGICKSYAEELDMAQQQIEKEQEKVKKLEESNHCIMQQLEECMVQNCTLIKEKALIEQNNCEIISELEETHKSLLELKKECQLKNKSLACISAELTEAAMSRSELCNQSQYVVSCIRVWMEEQRECLTKLNSKLKSQQQQLIQFGFEKKTLLDEMKRLKRINHLLTQRLKRMHRHCSKSIKNVCVGCYMGPWSATQETDVHIPINSKYLPSQKKLSLAKTSRRVSAGGNAWLVPRMKYLINELRKSNIEYNENFNNRENSDTTSEESRDCGYQSSTSK